MKGRHLHVKSDVERNCHFRPAYTGVIPERRLYRRARKSRMQLHPRSYNTARELTHGLAPGMWALTEQKRIFRKPADLS
jgi:hypothetical protein